MGKNYIGYYKNITFKLNRTNPIEEFHGIILLEAIEKMIEYLLDNNDLGN